MRYCLIFCVGMFCHIFNTSLSAQEVFKRQSLNVVYVEALGSGKWYSLNYERIIENDWSVRLGVSFLPQRVENGFGRYGLLDLTLPCTITHLLHLGNSAHNIELGVGASPTLTFATFDGGLSNGSAYNTYSRTLLNTRAIALVGYRFQPIESGLVFRITFTPSVEFVPGVSPPLAPPQLLYGGISIGYAF